MKLPNGDQAIIDRRKIVDYCLSRSHEDGQHKAHLFESIVGLTEDDADLLLDAVRRAASDEVAAVGKLDEFGQRYAIDFTIVGLSGTATVRSAWIIRTNETVPRLVTCYD